MKKDFLEHEDKIAGRRFNLLEFGKVIFFLDFMLNQYSMA